MNTNLISNFPTAIEDPIEVFIGTSEFVPTHTTLWPIYMM